MPTEIILDENGKITPGSGLFKQLDEWHENNENARIVEARCRLKTALSSAAKTSKPTTNAKPTTANT
ncbi:MAG: hypothetical protein K2J77_11415 [Oscillospiraceae bacterium]|nr:hypothetical protein [Oscillospiraceae bacterium]